MATLAQTHRLAQQRLQQIVSNAVGIVWASLGSYNKEDVKPFLAQALPLIEGGQLQSAALVAGYISRQMKSHPFGIAPQNVTGAAVRNGVEPAVVYTRAFIGVWQDLGQGKAWPQAVASGQARVESSSAMDMALSQRAAFADAQDQAPSIYGYQRVASGNACEYCQNLAGSYVKSANAMPLHNHCSCTLEPLTSVHSSARYLPDGSDVNVDDTGIRQNGELGAVITRPGDSFMSQDEIPSDG